MSLWSKKKRVFVYFILLRATYRVVLIRLMTFLPAVVRDSVPHLVQSLTYSIVIRNQIKSLYRFGHRTTDCDRKFNEFKFCLTLKVMHPEERREAWIRRRAEWWAHRRLGKSSENVWDIRKCVSLPL